MRTWPAFLDWRRFPTRSWAFKKVSPFVFSIICILDFLCNVFIIKDCPLVSGLTGWKGRSLHSKKPMAHSRDASRMPGFPHVSVSWPQPMMLFSRNKTSHCLYRDSGGQSLLQYALGLDHIKITLFASLVSSALAVFEAWNNHSGVGMWNQVCIGRAFAVPSAASRRVKYLQDALIAVCVSLSLISCLVFADLLSCTSPTPSRSSSPLLSSDSMRMWCVRRSWALCRFLVRALQILPVSDALLTLVYAWFSAIASVRGRF